MKAIKLIVIFAVLSCLFCSCVPTQEENMDTVKMTAVIKNIGDNIEVEVIEAEYGATGPFWVITKTITTYLNKKGNLSTRLSLNV